MVKDERLMSRMEGKTNFSRRLKNSLMAWPDWTRSPPPYFTTIYATVR